MSVIAFDPTAMDSIILLKRSAASARAEFSATSARQQPQAGATDHACIDGEPFGKKALKMQDTSGIISFLLGSGSAFRGAH
jgi:hypothetical protein